jgi:hypothetical protein
VFICIEGYQDAAHLLLHVKNVLPYIGEHILPHAPVTKVRVFGPEAQLEVLKTDVKFVQVEYQCVLYFFFFLIKF